MYVQAHMTIPIRLFPYYVPKSVSAIKHGVCANTFIGPDIEIGEGAVIGAGTVMVKDAEPWGVYAGNPAKYIKKTNFEK